MCKNVIIMFLAVMLLCGNVYSGSIWAKRENKSTDLYADDKARSVGDIVTIIVNEDSTVDNKAKRTMEKSTKRSAQFDGDVGIDHLITDVPAMRLGAGTEYTNELDGKADYKDERTYTDSISVVIVDVMPNGNLVVWGTRDRDISDDIQTIEISGIIRPSDIEFDNTIQSEKVANFSVVTHNAGASAPFNRPNWLGGIFNVIWPF